MANTTLFRSLSASTQAQRTPHGLQIQTAEATINVSVYTPEIIRICIEKNAETDFSYAVIIPPQNSDFEIIEQENVWQISTAKLRLEVSKSPVRFRFFDKNNQLLNEDDAAFGTGWLGEEVSTYKKLQPYERFLGLGEKTGNQDKRGRAYTNWNTDSFAYGAESDPLYQTLPFYIGVHSGVTYGIFMDSTYRSWYNFGASNNRFASFAAQAGRMNYYFIHDTDIKGIIAAYTQLTGRAELPPRWSLGLQQCRYSYYPDVEVQRIADTFRQKQIPADALYLDIHYMQDYKVFTWHNERFSSPKALTQKLAEQGFEVVVITDPGIKIEDGYTPYEEGKAQQLFLQYPDGENYAACVWPGWCHFPDFTNPAARAWWANSMQTLTQQGVTGFWTDMNEPASWGQATPDLVEFDYEGARTSHKQGHNTYGLQMTRATYEGARQHLPEKRPFVLTRAGYAGVQRYGAVWTGDNIASDEHLLVGVRLLMSMGLTGVSFTGTDIGGFVGEASKHLFARWISVAAFTAYFRIHTMIDNRPTDAWSFGERTEAIARNYINLRYQLLPYLYAMFWENSQTGLPIVRSLAIEHSHDEKVYLADYQNQFMCGESLLVCPTESYQKFCKVYLPANAGGWYDFYNGKHWAGEQEIIVACPVERLPVFVKAGGILLAQNVTQHTKQKPQPILHLHLYRGAADGQSLVWYEDDGASYAYTQNEFYKRRIDFYPTQRKLKIQAAEGSYTSDYQEIKIYLHDFGKVDGLRHSAGLYPTHREHFGWLEMLPNFDPFVGAPPAAETAHCHTATVPNTSEIIELEW